MVLKQEKNTTKCLLSCHDTDVKVTCYGALAEGGELLFHFCFAQLSKHEEQLAIRCLHLPLLTHVLRTFAVIFTNYV